MAFRDIFKDENDINEKSVVGFSSFIVIQHKITILTIEELKEKINNK